jgi:hypothetical protein
MNKGNAVYIHNGVLFSHNKELNHVVFRQMDRIEDHYVK